MVNGSKEEDHILIRRDLGMRRKKMKIYPKVFKAKFLLVLIVLRKDILLKNTF